MTTVGQLRAARALLGLSQPQLAELCRVSTMTIKRAEGAGNPLPSLETIARIKAALEEAGIDFLDENGGGPGVRVRKGRSHVE